MFLSAASVALFFLCLTNFGYAAEGPDNNDEQIWAVLVAGSNGWWNYRHQADICHAYHTLINHGVNPAHIITMMYDDIANDTDNPYPGKIYNHPNGTDVYAGVRIDYSGADVNPKNFMAVLLGDKKKVKKGKPVLKSTKKDKVFIFFSDHGASGLVAFPNDILTEKQLTDTLKKMSAKGMFNELTFYLEACESGSMFDRKVLKPLNIYAVTAANADESSYATYCGTEKLPNNCLGDEFSVNWMEDSDVHDLTREKLLRQFMIVRQKTKESHVTAFRNAKIQREPVSEFIGSGKNKGAKQQQQQQQQESYTRIPARDVPLFVLSKNAKMSENDDKIRILKQKRQYLGKQIEELVGKILGNPDDCKQALSAHPKTITELECHHQLVNAFHQHCFNLNENPYAMKYVYVLSNLCEHHQQQMPPEQMMSVMKEHCSMAAHAKNLQIGGIL